MTVSKTAAATASLTWTSSSRERPCIAEDELKRAVSARLGRDPFVPVGQGEIAIDGKELLATVGHLRARIEQHDREGNVLGTRELDATSCDELRRSATFVVFLIVDRQAADRDPATLAPRPEKKAPEKNDEPEEPTPPSKEEKPHPPIPPVRRVSGIASSPRRAAKSQSRVRVDLGLALVVSNGLLPKPDGGPALALGVSPLQLPLRFEWRASYRMAVHGVEGYNFHAVEQQWRACYATRVFSAVLGTACGGAMWTAILPQARGLESGDQAPKTVFSPLFAVGPAFEVEGTRLFVDFALMLPRPRYAFTYRDEGRVTPLYELSRVLWSVGIGASRSFR